MVNERYRGHVLSRCYRGLYALDGGESPQACESRPTMRFGFSPHSSPVPPMQGGFSAGGEWVKGWPFLGAFLPARCREKCDEGHPEGHPKKQQPDAALEPLPSRLTMGLGWDGGVFCMLMRP